MTWVAWAPEASAAPPCEATNFAETQSPQTYPFSAFLGVGDFEVKNCTPDQLEDARVSIKPAWQVDARTVHIRGWSSIDSSVTYLRYEDVGPFTLTAEWTGALLGDHDESVVGGLRFDAPEAWPLSPSSEAFDGVRPAWWDVQRGDRGLTWYVQSPTIAPDCGSRVRGAVAFQKRRNLYVYVWNFQWYSPVGGCGG